MPQSFTIGIDQKESRNVQIKYLMLWYKFQQKIHTNSLQIEPGPPQRKILAFIYCKHKSTIAELTTLATQPKIIYPFH
jgi:hypothetical protein